MLCGEPRQFQEVKDKIVAEQTPVAKTLEPKNLKWIVFNKLDSPDIHEKLIWWPHWKTMGIVHTPYHQTFQFVWLCFLITTTLMTGYQGTPVVTTSRKIYIRAWKQKLKLTFLPVKNLRGFSGQKLSYRNDYRSILIQNIEAEVLVSSFWAKSWWGKPSGVNAWWSTLQIPYTGSLSIHEGGKHNRRQHHISWIPVDWNVWGWTPLPNHDE